MWVRQEADVEDEVAVHGQAVTIAEAGHFNAQVRFVPLAGEFLADDLAQLVHIQPGRVDHQIGRLADRPQAHSLTLNALGDRPGPQRVRPPGLAVTAHQRAVVGLEEDQPNRNSAPQRLQEAGQLAEFLPFAHIHHERRVADLVRRVHQLGKRGNQANRQIVHGIVAEILKSAKSRTFARAAETSEDDEFRGFRACLLLRLVARTALALGH